MAGLPVPVPRLWAPGDTVSAQRLNTNVRNAVNFLLSPPMFSGRASTAQSVPTGAWTDILLDITDIDTYGGKSVSNTAQYVAQLAGLYEMHAVCPFAAGTAGGRAVSIAVNGVRQPGGSALVGFAASGAAVPTFLVKFLSVGDIVTLQGWHSQGAALSTAPSTDYAPALFASWKHS